MTAGIERVLVTGGGGYIGSVLVGLLLRKRYLVRTIDNLSFGGAALLPFMGYGSFEFIKGDIRDESKVREALDDIDAVVHLAAIVGDPACSKNPELAREVNGTGAELLCNAAIDRGVRRFVFASTCSNYGRSSDPNEYVTEKTGLRPVSLYAELKVHFESYLFNLGLENFAPVCLRFATAYGLSGRPRFDLTVNEFTRELALGRSLEIYGESFWRPYCHTMDLSRAIIAALESETHLVAYQAFNVGDTEENYQKKMLADLIMNELPEKTGLVNYVARDEDPRDYRVDCSKIKKMLGFEITRRVPDGIREILFAIRSGLIGDPDNPVYRNV